jgi:phasin family protein
MFNISEEITAQQAANLEQSFRLADAATDAASQLLDLNLKTARATGADLMSHMRAISGARDVTEITNLQGGFTQAGSAKVLEYTRAVFGWASESQAQFGKLLETQVGEINRTLASTLDKAAKNAPTGSEFAFAAAKSALSAANQAYDALSKAGKQVMDVTEATVATASAPAKAASKKVA